MMGVNLDSIKYTSKVEMLFDEVDALAKQARYEEAKEKISPLIDVFLKYAVLRDRKYMPAILYRVCRNWGDKLIMSPVEMGTPRDKSKSENGRIFRAGATVIYLGDSVELCVAESGVDLQGSNTVGRFRINKKSCRAGKVLTLNYASSKLVDNWRDMELLISLMSHAFPKQYEEGEPSKYYSQQLFIELVRKKYRGKIEGVGWNSAIGVKGRCYAMFDDSDFYVCKTSRRLT